MKPNRFLFFGCLALMVAMMALAIDVLIEVGGIRARTLDSLWMFIFVSISVVVHIAFLLSPLFRHMSGGKRGLWTLCAIPMLFIYSFGATLVGQSSYIESQASQIEQSRKIKAQQLKLVDQYAKSASIQQRYDYATRSNDSLDKASTLLDQASKTAGSGNVTNSQAVELPLRLINALLASPISVKTFLIAFYTLMSFCLIVLGYFFSELALVMFDRAAGTKADKDGTEERLRTNNDLAKSGHLTDADVQEAINTRLNRESGTAERDINRLWITQACIRQHGKAKKGETLDKFIEPTKKKLKPWYGKLVG